MKPNDNALRLAGLLDEGMSDARIHAKVDAAHRVQRISQAIQCLEGYKDIILARKPLNPEVLAAIDNAVNAVLDLID